MAKRAPQPGSARTRQRGKPVQVQPRRPWGFLVGAGLLGLLLIGIIAYAVLNQGEGFQDPVERADSSIEGVTVVGEEELGRDHVAGAVDYPRTPPVGGQHNAAPQICRIYEEQVPAEHAVHSLEHGAVWITYSPDLPEEQVAALRERAEGEAYVLMSPQPDLTDPVVLSAWGRQLAVPSADDPRVEEFVDVYANGPQTPEKGASCAVGNSTTGADPAGAAPGQMPQPSPAAPAAPSPAG